MCVWLSGSTVETPNGWPHDNNTNSRGLNAPIVGSVYRDIGRSYIRTHKHAKDEYHILASNADARYDLWQFWHDNRLKLPRWYDLAKDIALIQPSSAFMERGFSILRACMDDSQKSSFSDRVAASALLKYNRGRGK